jgi:hypothetical protein
MPGMIACTGDRPHSSLVAPLQQLAQLLDFFLERVVAL